MGWPKLEAVIVKEIQAGNISTFIIIALFLGTIELLGSYYNKLRDLTYLVRFSSIAFLAICIFKFAESIRHTY